jgi:hypothetical protein
MLLWLICSEDKCNKLHPCPPKEKRQFKHITIEVNLQVLLPLHAISDKVNNDSSSSEKMSQTLSIASTS